MKCNILLVAVSCLSEAFTNRRGYIQNKLIVLVHAAEMPICQSECLGFTHWLPSTTGLRRSWQSDVPSLAVTDCYSVSCSWKPVSFEQRRWPKSRLNLSVQWLASCFVNGKSGFRISVPRYVVLTQNFILFFLYFMDKYRSSGLYWDETSYFLLISFSSNLTCL
jgi:hypothetical protein